MGLGLIGMKMVRRRLKETTETDWKWIEEIYRDGWFVK